MYMYKPLNLNTHHVLYLYTKLSFLKRLIQSEMAKSSRPQSSHSFYTLHPHPLIIYFHLKILLKYKNNKCVMFFECLKFFFSVISHCFVYSCLCCLPYQNVSRDRNCYVYNMYLLLLSRIMGFFSFREVKQLMKCHGNIIVITKEVFWQQRYKIKSRKQTVRSKNQVKETKIKKRYFKQWNILRDLMNYNMYLLNISNLQSKC